MSESVLHALNLHFDWLLGIYTQNCLWSICPNRRDMSTDPAQLDNLL
jgi:hypothetical protein